MTSLTILVDMDDTIECLLSSWIDFVNNKYNTNVKIDDIKEWNVDKAFPTLTKEQVFSPLYEEELWKTVKPMDGAVEALRKIKEDGHKVFIVTSSNYKTLVYKMDNVLFKYFPYLNWSDVIVTYNKQMIIGDILIDDAPHNLEGGNYKKILMDSPHNRDYDAEANGVTRVYNWNTIYSLIKLESCKSIIKELKDNSNLSNKLKIHKTEV